MSFLEYARDVARQRSRAGAALVVLQSTPSTHQLARRIAQEYSDESAQAPAADFLAWQQTAGQGRHGRSWSSPGGAGVYATLIRRLASSALQTLPLLVATALGETLNHLVDDRCRLKWPNDLWVEGHKLGGILIDAQSRGDAEGVAVVSFGVNYGRAMEVAGATSVELLAPGRTSLPELVVNLVTAIDGALARSATASEVVERYRRLSLHRPGETLRCRTGDDEIEGVFAGFDQRGFLRLAVDGEERLLAAGEIDDHA